MSWLPVLSLLALQASEAGTAQTLTMDQTVELAVQSSSALQAARARARGSEDQAKSLRGRFLPSVNLSDELQKWDSAFYPTMAIANLPSASFLARKATTNAFVAALGQPVLGLLQLSSRHDSLAASAEAAEIDARTLEASLRAGIRTLFLRMFEARALAGIARASQEQLREQQTVAKERLAAGVLTPADILRLDVAAANAKQQEIQALAAEQTTRSSLLIALGREPQDTSVEFVEPETLDKADERDGDVAPLVSKAVQQRTELRSAMLLAKAADSSSRSSTYRLLPDLDLEAG